MSVRSCQLTSHHDMSARCDTASTVRQHFGLSHDILTNGSLTNIHTTRLLHGIVSRRGATVRPCLAGTERHGVQLQPAPMAPPLDAGPLGTATITSVEPAHRCRRHRPPLYGRVCLPSGETRPASSPTILVSRQASRPEPFNTRHESFMERRPGDDGPSRRGGEAARRLAQLECLPCPAGRHGAKESVMT